MRRLLMVPVVVAVLMLGTLQAFAQSATVVLRNGDRLQAEVVDMGADFTFRINGRERQIPINDVVLIDFTGNGRDIRREELTRADNASGNGFVVMRNGDTFTGRLVDIHARPSRGVFSMGARTRDIELSDISRIYLGSPANVRDLGAPSLRETPPWLRGRRDDNEANQRRDDRSAYERRSNAPRAARTVVVPANVPWTNSGIQVSRGQWVRFEPSGEIRLSFNGDDSATAAGAKNYRFAEKAPIPTIPAGALIGRVNNGKPFSIGDTTQAFQMPANGTLFLGVNDDHVPDNSGNFVVKVWEP
jgi:hypothetical protein